MYNLPHFKSTHPGDVLAFVQEHPFAMLAGGNGQGKPVATQVPLFVDDREGQWVLSGHIMRNTDHHKAFLVHPDVLAIFSGPHAYISASWYKDPLQASTWNYMSVHAQGKIRFLDEAGLLAILERTTNYFEADPSAFSRIPDSYVRRLLPAIVGFEITVDAVDHVFKLSQNKDPQTFDQILEHLNQGTAMEQSLAQIMRKTRKME